jgi:tripartite-type tricarboxylate transporter receptor subunit TctC
VKAGRLRLLAVTHSNRMPSAPDVPTLQEDPGIAGFESVAWIGLFAPKGTPAEAIQVLNRLVANALQDPEVVTVLATGGFTAAASTPAQLAEAVKREYEQWGAVIRKHNIRVE